MFSLDDKTYYLEDDIDADFGRRYEDRTVGIDGHYYYFDDTGVLQKGGWIEVDYGWGYTDVYYAYDDGKLAIGWTEVDGIMYYFYEDNSYLSAGVLIKSTSTFIGETLYLFDEEGQLVTPVDGWNQVGDEYYYAQDGELVTDLWFTENGNTYYVDSYGVILRSGGYPIDDEFYYFDDNAVLQYGKWIEVVDSYDPSWNSWMYAKEDGTLVTGWHKINNKWYYFYYYTLVMDSYFDVESGDYEANEHYAFDKNGALIEKEGWQHMHHWFFEDSYNWVYVQKDGSLVKDQWKKISTNGTTSMMLKCKLDGLIYQEIGTS